MELPFILVVGFVLFAVLNSWTENARRLRCRARDGLFGTCGLPVPDGVTRCGRHRGLPKRRLP